MAGKKAWARLSAQPQWSLASTSKSSLLTSASKAGRMAPRAVDNGRDRMLCGDLPGHPVAGISIAEIKRVAEQGRMLQRADFKRQTDDGMAFGEQVLNHGKTNTGTAACDNRNATRTRQVLGCAPPDLSPRWLQHSSTTHHGQHPQGAAAALLDFQRWTNQHGTRGRQEVEIGQTFAGRNGRHHA